MKIRTYLFVLCLSLIQSIVAQDSVAVFKRANSFLVGLSPAVRAVYADSSNNSAPRLGGSVRFGYALVNRCAFTPIIF